MINLDFRGFANLLAGKHIVDVACPLCGPDRRDPANRVRKVLRLWQQGGLISFHCTRCGESGYVLDGEHRSVNHRSVDHETIARAKAVIVEREKAEAAIQLGKARWLWRCRQSIAGTFAEHYLRKVRAISCPLPPTLGFIPPRGDHPPVMIAAFGIATEPEPGVLSIADEAVRGVHLTRLLPDGSGKAEEPAKIMIGRSKGAPIVLAPPNDLLGLIIAEGIEDALSAHQATGLGTWAAGSASRLPALADQVPGYIDCVTVLADDDADGQRHAPALAERLVQRGIHAELSIPGREAS
ncbi:toprim domain-containing protein [Mesorhizobium sp.]|uniref:toprim domain-containing protein n=1 Tax=Mesorhizobium sp. TaxID=1871066 RepID=UPI0012146C0C|nr:toprim domain-containing protein [Mesorhizobium sp.]TIL49093.1 MAG: hypothetical protein E5Y83_28240 [Mesorhizobium sp.]